jgi:CysZ protein
MFASAGRALAMIFDPAFFWVLIKSLVLTVLLFAGLFVAMQYGLAALPTLGWHWVNVALNWVLSIGFFAIPVFIGAPVAAIFASLFLDDISAAAERKWYPGDAKAPGAPFLTALWVGLRFAFWVLVINLILLPFNFVLPVIAWIVTLLLNGWLLGREFWELAALRHLKLHEVDASRRRHAGVATLAGIVIAALALIPIVSFFVPMFGVAFMALVYKRYEHLGRV